MAWIPRVLAASGARSILSKLPENELSLEGLLLTSLGFAGEMIHTYTRRADRNETRAERLGESAYQAFLWTSASMLAGTMAFLTKEAYTPAAYELSRIVHHH